MAEQDRGEELITYLKSLGFEGEKLEEDIKRELGEVKAAFMVSHRIEHGDEVIQYNLRFIRDRMFNAYRLEGYKVLYREPIVIEHSVFGDIDTALLEESMRTIDWSSYFRIKHTRRSEPIPDTELALIKKIEEQMKRLGQSIDHEANEIHGQLTFKYWDEEFWDPDSTDLHAEYGKTLDFTTSELAIANSMLAFNLASGRFDRLYRTLLKVAPEDYPGTDIKDLLAFYLSADRKGFDLEFRQQEDQGFIDFCIPVKCIDNQYIVDITMVSFTRFPDIEHGTFQGIDTARLEDQMKLIDWKDGDIFYFDEVEDVILYPYVQTIKDNIDQLNSIERTKDIAEYLQIKYWSGSFMEIFVDEETWKMSSWPTTRQQFPVDVELRTIANLMQGRPVHSSMLAGREHWQEGWFLIDPTAVADNGLNPMERIAGPTWTQIERMVNMLPLNGTTWVGDIVRSIQKGNKTTIDLMGIDGKQTIMVSIPFNPGEMRLDVFTPDGLVIPVNFSLTPDWTTDKLNAVKPQNTKQSGVNEKPAGNNKRKGKRHRK